MKGRRKIIAIDFDGTIVKHQYPGIGPVRKNALKVINRLYDEGYIIIIWTCRYTPEDLKNMTDWLDKSISYNHINSNDPELRFQPTPKIYADTYIDDRQVGGLPGWLEIYKIITGYAWTTIRRSLLK
jgi:hydroxymethylpyrimidine pyrophosphatase-like HAD family hydrolase